MRVLDWKKGRDLRAQSYGPQHWWYICAASARCCRSAVKHLPAGSITIPPVLRSALGVRTRKRLVDMYHHQVAARLFMAGGERQSWAEEGQSRGEDQVHKGGIV